jgi:hypothetical protein
MAHLFFFSFVLLCRHQLSGSAKIKYFAQFLPSRHANPQFRTDMKTRETPSRLVLIDLVYPFFF